MSTQRSSLVLVVFFLLLVLSPQSNSLQLTQLNTLISLSRSLLARVSASRAARGDDAGARRAAAMADALRLSRLLGGFGGGGGGGIWSVGWDLAGNYAWRLGGAAAADASLAAGELAGIFADAVRSGVSNEWLLGNYDRVIRLSNSLFRSLLREFSRTGPLRDMVLLLQKEVTEGELLKDCLEVGGRDLQGVFQIARELFFSVDTGNSEL